MRVTDIKTCTKCRVPKHAFEFHRSSLAPDGRRWVCKECERKRYEALKCDDSYKSRRKAYAASLTKSGYYRDGRSAKACRRHYLKHRRKKLWDSAKYYSEHLNFRLLTQSKRRAKLIGVAFDLTYDDIRIPSYCPVLGIPIFPGKGHACDNSPSVDRIIPSLGYTKGNIMVIFHRANTIKSNSTVEELRKVYEFYQNYRA